MLQNHFEKFVITSASSLDEMKKEDGGIVIYSHKEITHQLWFEYDSKAQNYFAQDYIISKFTSRSNQFILLDSVSDFEHKKFQFVLEKPVLDSLRQKLNWKKDTLGLSDFNYDNGFNLNDIKMKILKQRIRKKKLWKYFKVNYKGRKRKNELLGQLIQSKNFEAFLTMHPAKNSISLFMTSRHEILLEFITEKDTIGFVRFKPFRLSDTWLRQGESEGDISGETIGSSNPVINEFLVRILPQKFLGSEFLKRRHIYMEYIDWYINEKMNAGSGNK